MGTTYRITEDKKLAGVGLADTKCMFGMHFGIVGT